MNTYTPPQVRDYGTLLQLTADLDVNLVGVTSRLVMAAMSGPTGGGPGGPGGTPENTVLTPNPGGGGVGGTITPDGPTGNGGGATPGGVNEVADRDASGGGGSRGGGAGGGGAGGGGLGAAAAGEQRKLPFTGFPVLLAASVGAVLTSGGVLLRSKLRRRAGGSD